MGACGECLDGKWWWIDARFTWCSTLGWLEREMFASRGVDRDGKLKTSAGTSALKEPRESPHGLLITAGRPSVD